MTMAFPHTATAHGVDLQHFRPATGGQALYGIEQPILLEVWKPTFGLALTYSQGALRLEAQGQEEALSQFQAVSYLQVRLGVLPWADVGVDLPFVLDQAGVPLTGALDSDLHVTGTGDLRISPRFRVLDPAKWPIGLILSLPVTLPTGLESDYLGEDGSTFNPQLGAGGYSGRLAWAASVGYRLRPAVDIYYYPLDTTLALGNEFTFGAALDLRVIGPFHLVSELEGKSGMMPGTVDDPLEARLGMRLTTRSGITAVLGGSAGLINGYGASKLRGFVGIHYSWAIGRRLSHDLDGDGIAEKTDKCPQVSEDADSFEDEDGCPEPDNDGDGILDIQDRCPLIAESVNRFEDEDGCPDIAPDVDRDGIADALDACKTASEDVDRFQDEDGCPDPDNDTDGIEDAEDQCPDVPETRNNFLDDDGCPDEAVQTPDDSARLPVDNDKDGVPDKRDKCPKVPELHNGLQDDDGCPEQDQDGDSILEPLDQCPKQPETRNGFQDDDGCPELDSDSDGIPDGRDKCPKRFETRNGFQDDDGCPEPDSDGDGLIDGLDQCPKLPETVNGIEDFDGCPEMDTDGDGFPDARDRCPNKPERVNRFEDEDGCPEPDSDGDGIIDGLDKCPHQVEIANGYRDEDGCPDRLPDGRPPLP